MSQSNDQPKSRLLRSRDCSGIRECVLRLFAGRLQCGRAGVCDRDAVGRHVVRALKEGHADGVPQVRRRDAIGGHVLFAHDLPARALVKRERNPRALVEQFLGVDAREADTAILHGLRGVHRALGPQIVEPLLVPLLEAELAPVHADHVREAEFLEALGKLDTLASNVDEDRDIGQPVGIVLQPRARCSSRPRRRHGVSMRVR